MNGIPATVYSTQSIVGQYVVYTVDCTSYSIEYSYGVQCVRYHGNFTSYSIQYSRSNVQCSRYIIHYARYSIQ